MQRGLQIFHDDWGTGEVLGWSPREGHWMVDFNQHGIKECAENTLHTDPPDDQCYCDEAQLSPYGGCYCGNR